MMGSSTIAKEKDEETNIICFAAKNKWICAPEDKQEIASKKAEKLIEKHSSELSTSEVVIKTINMPKFNSINSVESNRNEKPFTENTSEPLEAENVTIVRPAQQIVKEPLIKDISLESNPYAKLWSHQLIGLSNPQSAINFIKQKDLNKDDILVIKSTRAGMDWWIILYGLYKDKSTGQANEINLPTNLDKPWLRPLKNLQVKGFIEKF